jgi:hypothetical protein
MDGVESSYVSSLLENRTILYFRRFIDDILVIVREAASSSFVTGYNSMHPNIKITSDTGKVANFLDVTITLLGDGRTSPCAPSPNLSTITCICQQTLCTLGTRCWATCAENCCGSPVFRHVSLIFTLPFVIFWNFLIGGHHAHLPRLMSIATQLSFVYSRASSPGDVQAQLVHHPPLLHGARGAQIHPTRCTGVDRSRRVRKIRRHHRVASKIGSMVSAASKRLACS